MVINQRETTGACQNPLHFLLKSLFLPKAFGGEQSITVHFSFFVHAHHLSSIEAKCNDFLTNPERELLVGIRICSKSRCNKSRLSHETVWFPYTPGSSYTFGDKFTFQKFATVELVEIEDERKKPIEHNKEKT